MGKILRRCDICKKFHAAYAVRETDTLTRFYCYDCWKAKFGTQAPTEQTPASPQQTQPPDDKEKGN